jgi:hypothetical protein
MADEPSPSAAPDAAAADTAVRGDRPGGAAGEGGGTPADAATASAGPSEGVDQGEGVNQGATGNRPLGESPLSAQATEKDAFAERPEAFVGAAFAGGLALAIIMRRLAR